MPWPSRLGDGNGKELSPDTALLQGVEPLPLWATGPPGPGGSTCQGPRPQGCEGARRESLAVVKAIHLGEITPDKSWSSILGVCREASSLTQENYLLKSSTWKCCTDYFRKTKACYKDERRTTYDVLEDIKSVNVRNWKKVEQNRDSWKKVVQQARTLYKL